MSTDSADEQATPGPTPRTLDAWSWVARARAAAARTVEPKDPTDPDSNTPWAPAAAGTLPGGKQGSPAD